MHLASTHCKRCATTVLRAHTVQVTSEKFRTRNGVGGSFLVSSLPVAVRHSVEREARHSMGGQWLLAVLSRGSLGNVRERNDGTKPDEREEKTRVQRNSHERVLQSMMTQ